MTAREKGQAVENSKTIREPTASILRRFGGLLFGLAALGSWTWADNAVFTRIHIGQGTMDGWPAFSSPTLVDLDGNPRTLEIVIGDQAGNVYGFSCEGERLWSFSIRNFAGFEGIQTACQSSPAVADLNGDGAMEVVVSLASRDVYVPEKPGAIFMFHLDNTGRNPTTVGGFARKAIVKNPTTTPSGFFASPTVADLDGDGDLEILATSWDQTCYAFHHNGALVWSLDYDLTNNEEYGFVAGDTIWTTPAVLDIDNCGTREVVFGSDAHLFPWGHQIPFQMKNGGVLIVLNAPTGHLLFGPNKFFNPSYHAEGSDWYYNANGENHIPVVNPSEVLQSSPVIADVDADGKWEIVHGTGQPVYKPTDSLHNRVFCWNGEDATQRWVTDVNGEVFACCALGNVDNDPDLEVFVRNLNEGNPTVYGLKGSTGQVLPGFPRPLIPVNPRSIGAVMGDVDGDGQIEIISISFGRIHVFGPTGVEETYFDAPNAVFTSPAIGDIDGDGKCEMVVGTDQGLWFYRCSGKAGAIPWGQYRRDARKSGVVPFYDATPALVTLLGTPVGGNMVPIRVQFHNVGSAVWTPSTVELLNLTTRWTPTVISLPAGTSLANGKTLTVSFSLKAPRQAGGHTLLFQLRRSGGAGFGGLAIQDITITQLAAQATRWELYR
jgi:hypothetical protein